jgi:uncharacterized membrane protein YdjX (TVP38/TMEM64 family)
MDPSAPPLRPRPRWHRPVLVVSGLAVAGWVVTRWDGRQVWAWVEALGPWAAPVFCLAYAGASAAMIPATVLTLAAGAKWGPVEGLAYVILGSNLGANLAFGLGRFVARAWVARLVARRPRFAAMEAAVAADGWKIVALLRLSPVFPFNVLNYALSLTAIRWRDYASATLVGMLPGTVLYVYLGSLVGVAARPHGRSPVEWVMLALGLAATVAVTVSVTRIARRALAGRLEAAGDGNA